MKLLLAFGIAASATGCAFWYRPVPVANAIGEERTVIAGDSVNVYRTERFEVYGPSSEAVYDGYEQLNRAYRSFERHVESPSTKLAFLLAPDSTTMVLDSATVKSFRDRGFLPIRYVRPRSLRTRSRGGLDYGGMLWPIAPTAARVLLARFAEKHAQSAGVRNAGDDALLELLPAWYRVAVVHLVAFGAIAPSDLEFIRDRRSEWLPLPQLLVLVRPAAADSALALTRGGDGDDLTRLIAVQAATVGRFLVEREGPAVMGRLGRGYLARRSLTEMIGEFQTAPKTLPELEQGWKTWMEGRDD